MPVVIVDGVLELCLIELECLDFFIMVVALNGVPDKLSGFGVGGVEVDGVSAAFH